MRGELSFGVLPQECSDQLFEASPLVACVIGFGFPIFPESTDHAHSHRSLVVTWTMVAWDILVTALDRYALAVDQPVIANLEGVVFLSESTVPIGLTIPILLIRLCL